MDPRPVVDIDDRSTWPADLAAFVEDLSDRLPKTPRGFDRLTQIDVTGWGDECRALLGGSWLRIHHATRLLPDDAEDITSRGLRTLTPELLRDRVDRARPAGHIDDAEHTALLAANVFTPGVRALGNANRPGKIWAVGARKPFTHSAHAFNDLLNTWGGEAFLYGSPVWAGLDAHRVRRLGTLSLVVAHIDVARSEFDDANTDGLVRAFVAAVRRMRKMGCTIRYLTDIPGEQIEKIQHPGDRAYDRHPGLART